MSNEDVNPNAVTRQELAKFTQTESAKVINKRSIDIISKMNQGWPKMQELLLMQLDHFDIHGDCMLMAKTYAGLVNNDHNTVATCYKRAAMACRAITFRTSKDNDNWYEAFVDKKKKAELESSFEKSIEALDKGANGEGLKSYKPKRNSTGGNKNSSVDNMGAVIVKALDKLEDIPGQEDYVSEKKAELSRIFADIHDHVNSDEKLRQLFGVTVKFKELAQKAKEKGNESTNDSEAA